MAKIDSMRLLRARIATLPRGPWTLLLLFAVDAVDLVASIALALSTPTPPPRLPYAAVDVPAAPTQWTLGVALMGIALGVLMGAALVAELWVMVRRAQVFSWRYGTRRRTKPPRGAEAA